MKLKDIKTNLFTNTSITDYGVRFTSHNHEQWKAESGIESHKPHYSITIHCLKDGSFNTNAYININLTNDQGNEIMRVCNLLKGE